ncbi:hypothetical protein SAMN04489806_0635 [Paramicrobacterium humi]|uniref:Uncharacterized protein n=1 Tax=Paramicrobacterium humi TaxID=640635 RepID=A0A1H4JDB5_9MICO|nr:hypothetical protein [Microbacterium humi]SEB44201.1 hypothetical protein SAMN04489806_0635 [Microbacterium humi]
MSNTHSSTPGAGGESTADTAKQQASQLGSDAVDAGKDVGAVAKDEAGGVAQEAKSEAKDLLHEARGELRDQAAQQQQRVAGGLRSVGDELHSMASSSENGGVATDLVRQAASKTKDLASWLDERDPGSLLEEVKSFARRRPGVFIGVAAVAGVVAGRLTRSIASGGSSGSTSGSAAGVSGSSPAHAARTPNIGTPAEPAIPSEAERAVPPAPVGEATNPAHEAPTPPTPPAPPAPPPSRAEEAYTAPDSGFLPPRESRDGEQP